MMTMKSITTDKATFILYKDIKPLIDMMSNDQSGILFKSIYNYVCDGLEPETKDIIVANTFKFIKDKIDISNKKYEEICAKNKENIKKRWDKANTTKDIVNNTTVYSGNTKKYETIPTDTDTDTDIKKDTKVSKKENKPSVDEINFAFATFYENYGVKKSKGQALKAFNKLKPQQMQKVLDVVQSEEFQKHQQSLIKNNGDFRQHPSTWLNAMGWENNFNIQNKISKPSITTFNTNEEPF